VGVTEELEYDESMISLLEAVWGKGFMSPGGADEVDRVLGNKDLSQARVLDIGSGIGGAAVHIALTRQPSSITGIDIEENLVDLATALAEKNNVSAICDFQWVETGPLPFDPGSFDIVFSKDSIIHIADKFALANDVHRLLSSGGWFLASDWLCGYDGEPSPQMQAYIDAEGLDFGLASAEVYQRAFEAAGFVDIELEERNAWYRTQARVERDNLAGPLYDELLSRVGEDFLSREIDVWDKMIVVLDSGEHRPTLLRARKKL
jgi:phosphoethanolamine N-methyltransferase